jgi:hypothetical protein
MINIQGIFSAIDDGKVALSVANPLTGNSVLVQEAPIQNGVFSIDIERLFPYFTVAIAAQVNIPFQMTLFFIDSNDTVRFEGESFMDCIITSGAMQRQKVIFEASIAEYEREIRDLRDPRQVGDIIRVLTMDEARPIRKALQEKILESVAQHIRMYPSELYSAYLLNERKFMLSDDDLRALYTTLSSDIQESMFIYGVRHRLQYVALLREKDDFVDGQHYDIHGAEQTIATVRSHQRYTILHFWNSSPLSIKQIDTIKNIHQRFTNDDVHVVGISLDDKEEVWKELIEKHVMNWAHLNDFHGLNTHFSTLYQLVFIATCILLVDHTINKIVYQGILGVQTESDLAKIIGRESACDSVS